MPGLGIGLGLTARRGGAWSPASLSGLAVTLLPALSRSQGKLWQDAAKTTPATANNDPVRVAVCPYTAVEFAAPSDAARPTLTDEGGGKWSLTFNGSTQYMSVSSPSAALLALPDGDFAVGVSARWTTTGMDKHFVAWGNTGGGTGFLRHSTYHLAAGRMRSSSRNDSSVPTTRDGSTTGVNNGNVHGTISYRSGSTYALYTDGAVDATGATMAGTATCDNVTVGAWLNTAASGHIAARISGVVAVLPPAITSGELAALTSYLRSL